MSGWKPIATAPKDGTGVLLRLKPDPQNITGMAVGRWDGRDWVVCYNERALYVADHWPTHWHSLPKPPNTSSPTP